MKIPLNKRTLNKVTQATLAVIFLTSVLFAQIATPGTVEAAPLSEMTIDGVECTLKLVEVPTAADPSEQGEFSYISAVNVSARYSASGESSWGGYNSTSVSLPMRWYIDTLQGTIDNYDGYDDELDSDVEEILRLSDPGNSILDVRTSFDDIEKKNKTLAIVFDAKVAGNGDPQRKCRQTPNILFSRPGNPREFFGTYKNNGTILKGTLNATAKTIRFDNTAAGADTYNVKGADALFGSQIIVTDGSAVGFCAGYPSGPVYDTCMKPQVMDFNTISWRGEKYRLKSWQGNQSIRMEYELDAASSPHESRKIALAACGTKPKFRIDNDAAGKIDELTTDNDNGVKGFFGQLTKLATVEGSQKIQFVDVDIQCNVEDEKDIELYNLRGFLNIAQYFEKDGAAGLIPNNPGSGEEILKQIYTKTADPLVFGPKADATAKSCALTVDNSSIKFTTAPSANVADGTYLDAYWTFPNPDDKCNPMGTNIKVKYTGADSPETIEIISSPVDPVDPETPDEVCGSGGALGWLLCPLLALLDETTQELENQIQGFLFVDTDRFDRTTDGGKQMYAAWSTFRGLATVIIVIIALMMIFSQAMGEGIFDNYSLKKILPRLILAGIGIQLSWFMLVELVNIFNVIGNGIGGIVLTNFGLTPDTNLRDILGEITKEASIGDFATGTLFVGLAIVGPFFLGGLFAIAIGVAAAVFVGLITLIVRDMIILVGVITAPIAIAMSVLPGTQKTSKWWWESLEKALMMYPIIMLLLAVGKVIGDLLFKSATPTGTDGIKMTYLIAGIIAWYLPFFFLPKALAAGGSLLGKVTGFAGDKSKGLFGSLQKGGQNLKEKRRGWAANKYVPGGGKMRNTAAILGSGSFSKRAALQKGGQYYSADLKKAQEELVAINRISNPKDRAKALGDMAVRSNPRVAQAAMEQLMKTGEIETLRQVMTAPNRNKLAVDTFRNTSFGDLKGKALDLAKDKTGHELQTELAKLSTADILGQDRSTIRDAIAGGIQPVLASRAVASMKDEKQWDNLGIEHKARLLHLAGAAVDIEGTNMDHGTLDDLRKKTLPATPPAGPPLPPPTPTPPPGPPLPPPTPTPPPGPPLPPPTPSDIRLKRDINFIETRHGLKLYSFQYLWSDEVYVGVMAQDLVDTHPEALSKDRFGYYMVDYSMLGIEMQTLEEWTKQNTVKKA